LKLGENAIGADGFWGLVRSPEASLAFLALLATLLFVECFGGGASPSATGTTAGGHSGWEHDGRSPGENTASGSIVESRAEAETLRDQPSNLNQRQPVPPDFGVT
jgi:hypothetical protein